jgi:hypothetical protein
MSVSTNYLGITHFLMRRSAIFHTELYEYPPFGVFSDAFLGPDMPPYTGLVTPYEEKRHLFHTIIRKGRGSNPSYDT